MTPTYFRSPSAFRAWLTKHHATSRELLIGLHKQGSGIYSCEQRSATLPASHAARMAKHKAAWSFFQAQPPSYRKTIGWWVVSAKKEETRLKRLDQLIEDSALGRRR